MRLSEECVCGSVLQVQGLRRHAQFVWATWRQAHTECAKPVPVEDEPERSGSHSDTQLGRSQDGRWIGGYDYVPQVEMKGVHIGFNGSV